MGNRLSWLLVSVMSAGLLTLATFVLTGRAGPFVEPNPVIISEVAWTGASGAHWLEWIELYNRSNSQVDMDGWLLTDSGDINITLQGVIGADEFHLLETDELAVSDIPADKLYSGLLADTGESLRLLDGDGQLIDSANIDGGEWPAGANNPTISSMERSDPDSPDSDSNWNNNDGQTCNGVDFQGNSINGTPKQPNSSWPASVGRPDLFVKKSGPITATAGSILRYALQYGNVGEVIGEGAILSDSMPSSTTYISDTSGLSLSLNSERQLVWHIGDVLPDSDYSFELILQSDSSITGLISNGITIGPVENETVVDNNQASALTQIDRSGNIGVLIDAVYYDSYETFEPDEAIRLIGAGQTAVDISRWRLGDGESEVVFPENTVLAPYKQIWACKNAVAFFRQFGFEPDFAVESENSSAKTLDGSWPRLSNNGDEVFLLDSSDQTMDVVVYKLGDDSIPGWSGPAVNPYVVTGVFGEEGQILFRKREQSSGFPVQDTGTAADWAQDLSDPINGRKVQYPGWDLGNFFFPSKQTEHAEVILGITPDNGYELVLDEIEEAQNSIIIEFHTMTHPDLANALHEAASRGVSVTLLLEGSPVGGIEPEQILACDLLEQAGGQCWYMISNSELDIYDRYRYLHAKIMIVDGSRAIISTENLSPNSLPNDDKRDGTIGRRGVILVTDSSSVVTRLKEIWRVDFDPNFHLDIVNHKQFISQEQKITHQKYFTQEEPPISYTVRFSEPTTISGTFSFEVIQSPENSLRDQDGIIALIHQTGLSDTILVEQLSERPHWGSSMSSSESDPNPRLEAYLDAARRGAKVRILLDGFFLDQEGTNQNFETCEVVNAVAQVESLDLACEINNPTGLGIHNKMILIKHNDQGHAYISSLNGSELSHKGNREVGIIIASDSVYDLLAKMFYYDWPKRSYLPIIFNHYIPPAKYVLVSEVLYDPSGREEAEFIELVNPTQATIDLAGFSLGDAVNRDDFEDVRRFPFGSILSPNDTYVVALTATGFNSEFGFDPDFEIVDSSGEVPNLVDDPDWGHPAAILRLGNQGDEVILRNPSDQIVDGIAYGNGDLAGTVACPSVIGSDYSLERRPYWRDTDDCPYDFREWPFPSPGWLP